MLWSHKKINSENNMEDGSKPDSFNTIGTIQYMGSKSRIIEPLCREFSNIPVRGNFVDLFSGTGTVAYAVKENYEKIYANDYQYYSYVLVEAILNGAKFTKAEEAEFWLKVFNMFDEIRTTVELSINNEESFFTASINKFENYQMFCDSTPNVLSQKKGDIFNDLLELCRKIRVGYLQSDQFTRLPVLFTTYYANTYFGVRQCCEIDAIRGCIETLTNVRQRYVLLAALMSAMSAAASTTTHFAQYLKVNNLKTAVSLIEKRKLSIIGQMRNKLDEFRDKGLLNQEIKKAECGNADYLEYLCRLPLNEEFIVYADPPYFKEHYSRYYHLLETLCLYDYPRITFNSQLNDFTVGRYREERAVSPFGKKSLALKAFSALVETCGNCASSLVVSYSDNSIVKVEDIISAFEPQYDTNVISIPIKHSGQGRRTRNNVNEVLIVGKPKKKYHLIGQSEIEKMISSLEVMDPLFDNPAAAMHNYMARKPYNVVNFVIQSLLKKKGLVLDPFVGSGTTIIEARKQGHNVIGVDINQQAILICEASLKRWDKSQVIAETNRFINELVELIESLYEVKIDNEVRYIERCHFDLIDGEIVPTEYWYKTHDGERLLPRRKAFVENQFMKSYSEIKNCAEGIFANKELIPNSRIAIEKGATVADYFCPRNIIAVTKIMGLLEKYKNSYSNQVLELIVSSSLNLIKLSDKKASSQMPYWRPKKNLTSRNALDIISNKAKVVNDGLCYLYHCASGNVVNSFNELTENSSGSLLIKSPIQKVPDGLIPDNVVDLIFTDPPYTDQVPYLEYSQLWSLILGWDNINATQLNDEIIVSNAPTRKDKTLSNFNNLMQEMFIRVYRMLKPQKYLVMFFHDFSLRAWSSLISAAQNVGLAYQGQVRIGRQRRSFKTVLSPERTLEGNYLIIFKKREMHLPIFDGDLNHAIIRTVRVAKHIICENGGKATAQELYDKGLLRDAIESGSIHLLAQKFKSFADVLKRDLNFRDGKWEV